MRAKTGANLRNLIERFGTAEEIKERIRLHGSKLTPMEFDVVSLRFEDHTLQEVAFAVCRSREGVRQIVNIALKKLARAEHRSVMLQGLVSSGWLRRKDGETAEEWADRITLKRLNIPLLEDDAGA